jgi:GNAT superfamily N-acetyltransferase
VASRPTEEQTVARPHIEVREATLDDVDALLSLWAELRSLSGRADRVLPVPAREVVRTVLARVHDDPLRRLVIASLDGEVGAMALFSRDPLVPLIDLASVQIDYVVVRNRFRRRGMGRALVAAATAYAEDSGSDHLVINVFPGLRDANRFYARLGFTPLVVRRVAGVAALRHRLAAENGRGPGREEVLALRRALRGRSRDRAAAFAADPAGRG